MNQRGLASCRGRPYLGDVRYLSRFSPFAAVRDLRLFLSHRQPYELWFGILAILVTAVILVGFVKDSRIEKEYKPNIIYVKQWRADRSDTEITAQQKVDQVEVDKRNAEIERRRKQRQDEFKRLDERLKRYGL